MLRRLAPLLAACCLAACSGPVVPKAIAPKVARIAASVLPATAQGCHSHLARGDEGRRGLVRGPHGVLLLSDAPAARHVRANAGDARTRWVGDPLPAPQPPGGPHVDIFYSPHPDDESLSAGVVIAQDAARGDRVIVVALTDGRDTRARLAVNARLAGAWRQTHGTDVGFVGLTSDAVGRARLGELMRATSALGVRPADVYAAHLDAPQSDCGGIVSVHEADQVERAFAARFPGATHITMSYDAEQQQDHLAAGVALRDLLALHVVTDAQWVVSRLWWTLPSPPWRWVTPSDPAVRDRVLRAASQYDVWDPRQQEYAIGSYSVREQFEAMQLDPRDRVHMAGPEVPAGLASHRT